MHLINLRREVIISPENVVKAGEIYICEDTNGAQLMSHANGGTMTLQSAAARSLAAAKPTDGRIKSARQVTKSATRGRFKARGMAWAAAGISVSAIYGSVFR